jgi:hypothetical protein
MSNKPECTLKQVLKVLHSMKSAILQPRHLASLPTVTMITKLSNARHLQIDVHVQTKRYIHGIISPVYKGIEHI